MESTRIDKWLWAARMFKTRSLAKQYCEAGHVRIDGDTAKPSKKVSAGVQIDVLTAGGPRVLEVIKIHDKRGPAELAKTLYIDHTPEPEALGSPLEVRERGLGRPTKRDRRRMSKTRGF